MQSVLKAVLSLAAISSFMLPKVLAQNEPNAFDAMAQLKTDPDGYVHIADDGVARSYDGNDAVIDCIPLSNNQLMKLISNLPKQWQDYEGHLHDIFDHVDGHEVLDEHQLLDPSPSLRRIVARDSPVSPIPRSEGESLLESRQNDYYCRGQPCTTSTACVFLGCRGCTNIDQVLPGGGGFCY